MMTSTAGGSSECFNMTVQSLFPLLSDWQADWWKIAISIFFRLICLQPTALCFMSNSSSDGCYCKLRRILFIAGARWTNNDLCFQSRNNWTRSACASPTVSAAFDLWWELDWGISQNKQQSSPLQCPVIQCAVFVLISIILLKKRAAWRLICTVTCMRLFCLRLRSDRIKAWIHTNLQIGKREY